MDHGEVIWTQIIMIIIMVLTTSLILFPTSSSGVEIKKRKQSECSQQCGGGKYLRETYARGGAVCLTHDEKQGQVQSIFSACILECMEIKPDENQLECMTSHCKQWNPGTKTTFHTYFCKKSEGPHIKPEECDTLVLSGEATRYGNCVTPSE